jgi:hypothetical protein
MLFLLITSLSSMLMCAVMLCQIALATQAVLDACLESMLDGGKEKEVHNPLVQFI